MIEEINSNVSVERLTEGQGAVYEVESFLSENYEFRRNVLSGKIEYKCINCEKADGASPIINKEWEVFSSASLNSVVRFAKKEGIGGDKSPRKDIEEYVGSDAVPMYDPIKEYLEGLPKWDGKNHVADLFGRIPGVTSEQLGWCCTWLRSAVAHWLGMDLLHGNENVPVLIGSQGCGKTTFATRLLPEELRMYFLDHINFGNKFDSDMALTNNLIVNIDEFANMGPAQQAKLKQTLSKVKVNGRPIFGKCQEDRRRYASFLATTNDEHPLCDPTGSRRFLCIRVTKGQFIDNDSPIDYCQLYAQILYELREEKVPYWFSVDQVERIQQVNLPYFKSDDMESIITSCFQIPVKDEGEWMSCKDVFHRVQNCFPAITSTNAMMIRIGKTLKILGAKSKHTKTGQKYQLMPM